MAQRVSMNTQQNTSNTLTLQNYLFTSKIHPTKTKASFLILNMNKTFLIQLSDDNTLIRLMKI